MPQNIGQLTIAAGVANRFLAPSTGIAALLIGNESGLTCNVTLEGIGGGKPLYPGSVDYFPVSGAGFTGNVLVSPVASIGTALLYPGSFLAFQAVGPQEQINVAAYPMALSRPMSAGTQSGAGGFSTWAVFTGGAGVTGPDGLNLFNPKSSGIVARIYAMQALVSDLPASPPTAIGGTIYTRTDGIDNGTDTSAGSVWVAQSIFAHNIGGSPSKMTANILLDTPVPAKAIGQQGFIIKGVLYDFLGPPDTIYLNPGQNILIALQNINYQQMLVLKWTES